MFKQLICFGLLVAIATAYPLDDADMVEDAYGQQYYLIPAELVHHRQRRQTTSGGITNGGFDISHTQPLINNANHKLDGTASLSKQFGGALSAGGGLDYQNIPSRTSVGVNAMHTPHYGTDVGAQARYNFLQSRDGRTNGYVGATYDRHFGGTFGTQRPNYGAMVGFSHRF